ncbi:MAG: putative lipid II flippase FtsW [Actinomycetota bacterium]|nr:putative lipid II flippase FtsW [Actinomycetota bacterium]
MAGTPLLESPADELRETLRRVLDRPLTSYYLVLGATAMLLMLGLVMVLSASSVDSYRRSGSSFAVFEKQALWFAVGLPLLWLAARLPTRAYRVLAYPALAGCLGLLALVPLVGVEVNGNTNWLDLGGPFRVQPSEPAKLALVIWGADLLARKHRLLDEWQHLLVPLLPVGGVLVGLVLLGSDLGTALVLMVILLGLLFFAGAPLRLFAGVLACGAVLAAALARTSENRLERITSWWGSSGDTALSWSYQATHGKYALASGGWWGLGLGASREKWGGLPEAHNDFIFAVLGEELGLVGTLAVLALFGGLGYAGLRIAARSTDGFVRLAAAGVTTWIIFQTLVNVGAVLGILPVIGIPLPLVSYGGSALLPTMLALGMLLAFARREPGAAEALAERGPGRVARALLRVPAAARARRASRRRASSPPRRGRRAVR